MSSIPQRPLALGIDYGTASGRVLVLDLKTGEELADVDVPYEHGVIEDRLPDSDERLGHDWALQHPRDYLDVVRLGVPQALAAAGVSATAVIGIGVDFTSCTVLPTTADGTPLCLLPNWRQRPHAWPKLWKHHAAQAHADRLTQLAQERNEPFLARCGGRISSEWYFPKLLQIYEEDREVYDAAERFIEATDWIVWQLTGSEARCDCAASYKAFWSAADGLPPADYFEAAAAGFSGSVQKLGSEFHPLGSCAGVVRCDLAEQLDLRDGVAVAVGNVDSFVSVPGAGVERPGMLVTVVGTSICDMVMSPDEVLLPGITGVVRDGIIPGLYGYEAGQPAVGDMLGWYVNELLQTGPGGYDALESDAGQLPPGSTGLLALNWWNGNRSILADADLSGVLIGMTLQTTPAEIYRALLESIAFTARRIVDNFAEHDLPVDRIVACGGIAEKSPVLMQLFADITGRPVDVPASSQIPARGAAVFGAVAAGPLAGGFRNITEAVARLSPAVARSYMPDADAQAIYNHVYDTYRGLHDTLGHDHVEWLHSLKAVRNTVANSQLTPAKTSGRATTTSLQRLRVRRPAAGFAELRDAVLVANLALPGHGLVTLTWGNASAIDREHGVFAIKPSGVPYDALTPADIVVLDLDGEVVDGALAPSTDMPTHLALYQAFEEIGGVVHTHSTWATVWAQAQREIPLYGTTHADLCTLPIPVTRQLTAEEIESGYEQNTGTVLIETISASDPERLPCALVRGHAPFAWGATVAKAVENAVTLEEIARMAFLTATLEPDAPPLDAAVRHKHYERKHGLSAYYGQR